VCYGAARERFLDAFADSGIVVLSAEHMDDAVDVAFSHARSGDVIALSPACSSFDEFSGFEERGRRFKEKVRQLQGS
jgi:UDP-N-acetylmuramoylalanine--D-glutamate ligase